MNTIRLIVASIVTQSVFQRFAQLSKKDKDAVVKKVKEKVNGKGNAKKNNGKKPKKGEVPPQFQKGKKKKNEKPPKEEKVVEEEVVGEKETGGKPEKGKVPPQFQKGKKKEEEAETSEEEVVEEDKAEGDSESKSLDNLVGDLAEEIEVIKTDGQIAPSEVLGLIDNVVKMVHVLLQAKPGKNKKASREEEISQRIADEYIEIDE